MTISVSVSVASTPWFMHSHRYPVTPMVQTNGHRNRYILSMHYFWWIGTLTIRTLCVIESIFYALVQNNSGMNGV